MLRTSIVSYSDIIFHSSYIKHLLITKYDITILADLRWKNLWHLRMEKPLDDVETFKTKNNFLISIGDRTNSHKNIQAQYMGLLKFSKKGFKILKTHYDLLDEKRKKSIDMTSMLQILVQKGVKIRVHFVQGKWIEVDSVEDFIIYSNKLINNDDWIHDWRNL